MTQSLTNTTNTGVATHRLVIDRERLADNMSRFRENEKSANTRATYATQWKGFVQWCAANNLASLPAQVSTACAYVEHLFDAGKKRSTIDVACAAIKSAHTDAGAADPFADAKAKRFMNGVIRTLAEDGRSVPDVKRTISQDDLRALAAAVDDTAIGLRDRAIILVGYAGWCRRGEPLKLRAENIVWSDTGAQCYLGTTKTDQSGTKSEYITVPRISDASICGYRALRAWLDRAEIITGSVFVHVKRGVISTEPLADPKYINEIVARMALRAGIDPKRIAPHRAFRASPITAAIKKGMSPVDVSHRARHKSFETTKKYVEANPADSERIGRAVYE